MPMRVNSMRSLTLIAFAFVLSMGAVVVKGQEGLGKDAGTGDVRRKIATWNLVRIETSAAGFSIPRQSKDLPLETRERKGISWGYGKDRRITAEVVFNYLKETVTASNGNSAEIGLKVLVKAGVTGIGKNSDSPKADATNFECTFDLKSASGKPIYGMNDPTMGRIYLIFAGSYFPPAPDRFTFSKKGEFECGNDNFRAAPNPEDDFTLNYRLSVADHFTGTGYEGDVTFTFSYKWAGWREPTTADNVRAPGDQGLGPPSISPANIGDTGGSQKSLIKPVKTVFNPNEKISVDYFNPKGSGWDYVVIVQPSRLAQAAGPHSSISPPYAFAFDPKNNGQAERIGSATFPALPEGEYEVRYISWDGGNNIAIAKIPFRVGSTTVGPIATPGNEAGSFSGDLTGLWRNPGGQAVYRVRQIGTKLVWGMDATMLGSFANMFQGEIVGKNIDGVWEDLPGSPSIGGGRMLLKIESACRFSRVSSVNPYGADVWVKKGSVCDVVGLTQKTAASGTTDTAKPSSSDKSAGPMVVVSDPLGAFGKPAEKPQPKPGVKSTSNNGQTKPSPKPADDNTSGKVGGRPPKVEEIPDESVSTASNTARTGAKPKVEEIPEEAIETPKVTEGEKTENAQTATKQQPNPQKTPKPKNPNGGILDNLGRAIGDTIRAGNSQSSQPAGGGSTGTQTGGGCTGGSFGLGAPRIDRKSAGYSVVYFPWSKPDRNSPGVIRVYRAGTNQQITDSGLPEGVCGESFGFNWDTNQFAGTFNAYLYDSRGRVVAGPVRFTVDR